MHYWLTNWYLIHHLPRHILLLFVVIHGLKMVLIDMSNDKLSNSIFTFPKIFLEKQKYLIENRRTIKNKIKSDVSYISWVLLLCYVLSSDWRQASIFTMIERRSHLPLCSVNPHAVSMPHALLHLFYSLSPAVSPSSRTTTNPAYVALVPP